MSYLFAYDNKDKEVNITISFEKLEICENFRKIDNDKIYSEKDCIVNISLSVQFRTINPEINDNQAQIYAIINRNNEKIVIESSIATSNIINIQTISISFITKLNKDDYITFNTVSDNQNIKIGSGVFSFDGLKIEKPVTVSVSINTI